MGDSGAIALFGTTGEGQPIHEITLTSKDLTAKILTYGATLRSLTVPDRAGQRIDVVLGHDTVAEYETQTVYMGATVGRCANRIAGGRFTLEGQEHVLAVNSWPNSLHGGAKGFDRYVWEIHDCTGDSVTLTRTSLHGEEGYPGDLQVQVTYSVGGGDGLLIEYGANTDRTTLCNLTNHSYFNLSGQGSGPVTDHSIRLFASRYLPTDETGIPLGAPAEVAGTPMDLRQQVEIGAGIDAPFPQLRTARGYDHCWLLDPERSTDRGSGSRDRVAQVSSPRTGIQMEVSSTMPAVQFYTANYLEPGMRGKGGAGYGPRHAFCLETQFPPDAIHWPELPQPVLKRSQKWSHSTCYRFSAVLPEETLP